MSNEKLNRREFLTTFVAGVGSLLGSWGLSRTFKNEKVVEETRLQSDVMDIGIIEGTISNLQEVDRNSLNRDLDLLRLLNQTRIDAGLEPIKIPGDEGQRG